LASCVLSATLYLPALIWSGSTLNSILSYPRYNMI
jgi:hypothetical protein